MDSEEGPLPIRSPLKSMAPSSSAVTSPVKQSPAKVPSNQPTPTTSPAASPSYDTRPNFIPSIQGNATQTQIQGQTQCPVQSQVPMESDSVNAGGASVTDDSCASHAVLLGIQELERQQEEFERKRKTQCTVPRANPFDSMNVNDPRYAGQSGGPQDHTGVPTTVHLTRGADSNSTVGTDNKDKIGASTGDTKRHSRVKSMTKFLNKVSTPLKPIRRSISDKFRNDPTPMAERASNKKEKVDDGSLTSSERRMKPILFGYLHKLGRNGKWQKRWFESDGNHLRYFKTKERIKLLATLDLLRVGAIKMDLTDSSGCTFTIEVSGRQYYLCADSKDRSRDWVITLNRIKEARMQIGGLKLISPFFDEIDVDERKEGKARSNSDSDEERVAARVVMAAARPRTRGLGKDDIIAELENSQDESDIGDGRLILQDSTSLTTNTAGTTSPVSSPPNGKASSSVFQNGVDVFASVPQMQQQVAVRWTKQRSAVENWARRMSRWAKRMTMVRCVIQDDVVHLNPREQLQQQRQNDRKNTKKQDDDGEEPFIDLDIARYSNCPESYVVEGHVSAETSTSRAKYEYKTESKTVQHNNSWNVHKIVDPSVCESSIQSSSAGRISPIPADDESGIIA